MTTGPAIAAVSAAIGLRLARAADTVPGARFRHGLAGSKGAELALTLFRLRPVAAEVPGRQPDPGGIRPASTLELDYLVAAFGRDDHYEPDRLIAAAMQAMLDRPVIDAEELAAAIAARSFALAGIDPASLGRPEIVTVELTPADLAALGQRFATAIGGATAAYRVRGLAFPAGRA
ncbi:hypothetical protein STVA_35360 [Allostella vacuolata]|nr:hypothetical protein STVA_35360 [Stella vacuolata]